MDESARTLTDPRDNALEVRILLAEDDPRMSSLLQRGFAEEGVQGQPPAPLGSLKPKGSWTQATPGLPQDPS